MVPLKPLLLFNDLFYVLQVNKILSPKQGRGSRGSAEGADENEVFKNRRFP